MYSNYDAIPRPLAKMVKAKNGVFKVLYYDRNTKPGYTAWDIKYKTIVDVDSDSTLNIIYDNYEKFK